jgi:hypothetical protein
MRLVSESKIHTKILAFWSHDYNSLTVGGDAAYEWAQASRPGTRWRLDTTT